MRYLALAAVIICLGMSVSDARADQTIKFDNFGPQGGTGTISGSGTYKLDDLDWADIVTLQYRPSIGGANWIPVLAPWGGGNWTGVATGMNPGVYEVRAVLGYDDGYGPAFLTTPTYYVTVD